MNTFVKIIRNGHMAPGKLANAELHFTGGELDGLKLIGFAIWARRDGTGQNVTFPARQFTAHGQRRSFSLLRDRRSGGTGSSARARAASVRRGLPAGERRGGSEVNSRLGSVESVVEEPRMSETERGQIPLEPCRQLFADEAHGLSDEEVEMIRRHADASAHDLVENRGRRYLAQHF